MYKYEAQPVIIKFEKSRFFHKQFDLIPSYCTNCGDCVCWYKNYPESVIDFTICPTCLHHQGIERMGSTNYYIDKGFLKT